MMNYFNQYGNEYWLGLSVCKGLRMHVTILTFPSLSPSLSLYTQSKLPFLSLPSSHPTFYARVFPLTLKIAHTIENDVSSQGNYPWHTGN